MKFSKQANLTYKPVLLEMLRRKIRYFQQLQVDCSRLYICNIFNDEEISCNAIHKTPIGGQQLIFREQQAQRATRQTASAKRILDAIDVWRVVKY